MPLPGIEVFIISVRARSESFCKKAEVQVNSDVFCTPKNLLCGIYVTFCCVQANYCYLLSAWPWHFLWGNNGSLILITPPELRRQSLRRLPLCAWTKPPASPTVLLTFLFAFSTSHSTPPFLATFTIVAWFLFGMLINDLFWFWVITSLTLTPPPPQIKFSVGAYRREAKGKKQQ